MGRASGYSYSGSERNPFGDPMRIDVRPFLVDAILPDGSPLSTDEPVLELGFNRKLYHFEKHKYMLEDYFAELALNLAERQQQGEILPDHIVGYTFARLARVAERVFGFDQVDLTLTQVPEAFVNNPMPFSFGEVTDNIRKNSNGRGDPSIVHMQTADFIARYVEEVEM